MKNTLLLCLAIVLGNKGSLAQNTNIAAQLGYPQMIVYNAKIVTMDDSSFESRVGTIAQAMAIRDGKILATGSNATIQALAGPQTKSIDLKGRTVLPSFFMTHEHPTDWAFAQPRAVTHAQLTREGIVHRWMPNVPPKEQLAKLDSTLREAVSKAKPGQWIFVSFNWGPNYEWAWDLTPLFDASVKKEYLDQLAPNNPVLVRDDFIGTVVNEKAVQEFLSVRPSYPQERDAIENFKKTGKGFFREVTADAIFRKNVPLLAEILKAEMEWWANYGVTTFASSAYATTNFLALTYLDDRGEMPARFAWGYTGPQWDMETLRYLAGLVGKGTDHLWFVGAWNTYGNQCMTVPAKPGTDPKIVEVFQKCNLAPGSPGREIMDRLVESGLRIATIHTGGDKDLDYQMDSIEQASKKAGFTLEEIRAKRHTFDHSGGAPRPSQIPRLKNLGMMGSLNNYFLWGKDSNLVQTSTQLAAQVFGTEYASWVSPRNSMTQGGVMSSFEIDRPLPQKLFFFIKKGMDRYDDKSGQVYGANERTDRIIQLKSLTRWGAYYVLREKLQGTLEPGKLADFIVLDKDYLTIPEDQIPSIQVLMTVVGGKTVHLVPSLATEVAMQPVGPTTWKEPIPPGW